MSRNGINEIEKGLYLEIFNPDEICMYGLEEKKCRSKKSIYNWENTLDISAEDLEQGSQT